MASLRNGYFGIGGPSTSSFSFTPNTGQTGSADWAAGDIAYIAIEWTLSSASDALTFDANWTQLGVSQSQSSSSFAHGYIVLTSGNIGTTFSFAFAGSPTRIAAVAVAIQGLNTSTVLDNGASNGHTENNETAGIATIAGPSITTGNASTFLLASWGARIPATDTLSAPGDHNTAKQVVQGSSTVWAIVGVSDLTTQPSSAATYGGYTATLATQTNTQAAAGQVAFLPAGAATLSIGGAAETTGTSESASAPFPSPVSVIN